MLMFRHLAFDLKDVQLALLASVIIGFLFIIIAAPVMHCPRTLYVANDLRSLETALTLYWLDHGSFPETLEDLLRVDDLESWRPRLNDLWGNDYRYRRIGEQYLLYSIGPDGVDQAMQGDDYHLGIPAGEYILDRKSLAEEFQGVMFLISVFVWLASGAILGLYWVTWSLRAAYRHIVGIS